MDVPVVEHEHGHHHGTGIPWLDIVVGVSAMFISVVSLVISIQHGRTMEKMVEQNEKLVAASTMPFLTNYGSQRDPVTDKISLRLIVKNGGVGPAVIDWFQVRYKGVAYENSGPLVKACCLAALGSSMDGVVYSNVTGTILPARETVDFLQLEPNTSLELQGAVDAARKDLTVSACYCSVLNECWITNFEEARPRPVAACVRPKDAVW